MNFVLSSFCTTPNLPPPAPRLSSPPIYHIHTVGWVGVGWRRRGKTRLSMRQLDNHGNGFCFVAVTTAGGRAIICVGWTTLTPYKGNYRIMH